MRDGSWLPLAPRPHRSKQPFLQLLGLLFVIYATLGRTGAHIGIPLSRETGIYIGDLMLLLGLAMLTVQGGYERFFTLPIAWVWFLFFIWNLVQTLPYLPTYGMVSLRDGALWGYSLFAVIVASRLVARPSGFVVLFNQFGRFARYYVYFVLLVVPISLFFKDDSLGFAAPVLTALTPHVTGSMAFVACRFVSVPGAWWWAFAITIFASATQGRGVFMAFLAATAVLWLLNPWSMRPRVRSIGMIGGLGLLLAATMMLNLNLGISEHGRVVGPSQLLQNLVGALFQIGETENGALDETRVWRMGVWNAIIDSTVFGPYFWTGKGYGINIVDDAGFSLDTDPPTRSPENAHITVLARSGVPGLLLWVVLQLTWAVGILRVVFFARRTGRRRATGLLTFLLAYWMEYMVHAATGTVLEGPYGGIPFWTIFGIGVAAVRMVRRDADFFERIEFSAAAARSKRGAGSARPLSPPRLT
jgi:hypothetical protein